MAPEFAPTDCPDCDEFLHGRESCRCGWNLAEWLKKKGQQKPGKPGECSYVGPNGPCLMPGSGTGTWPNQNRFFCHWHYWFHEKNPATREDFDRLYHKFEDYGWTMEMKDEIWAKLNGRPV